ncbi:DUF2127 domain-containing protein [Roseisalinus antarcticus]|uniref:DUF2127 domain-containing protein n=1 Tax=Roseisalinus antarcticus TaxID=254357 RepID=A0A1Y5S208_9RHOB|nr:DUF2127 domain-containing protein [Roseisalinus antarcticus]SLN28129.1 hypothetical protein ROA7023_00937 [Roseisalinus antarcticus]
MSDTPGTHRTEHRLFVLTLLAKGMLGVVQLMTAAAIALGAANQLPAMADWLVSAELAEDPGDLFASRIIALAGNVPNGDVTFYGVYFAAHGLLHLGVVVALLSGAIWAYPAGIAVLAGFVIYQLADWLNTGGVMLPILSAIDLAVIWMTLIEWRNRRRGRA